MRPLQVQGEQDDFGRVEVSLCPIPLETRGRLRLLPIENHLFELFGTFLRDCMEIAVLENAAGLPRQRHHQVFIVLGEGSSVIADETDPAVDIGGRRDGGDHKRLHGRMARRELQSGRIAARIVTPHRPPLADDRPRIPETESPTLIQSEVVDSASSLAPQVTRRRTVRSSRSTMPSVIYVAPTRSRAALQTRSSSRLESRSDASSNPMSIRAFNRALVFPATSWQSSS